MRSWYDELAKPFVAIRNALRDPRTALADVKAAHHWAENELKNVRPGSIREYCLTQEKKRLCELAWKIKRQIG